MHRNKVCSASCHWRSLPLTLALDLGSSGCGGRSASFLSPSCSRYCVCCIGWRGEAWLVPVCFGPYRSTRRLLYCLIDSPSDRMETDGQERGSALHAISVCLSGRARRLGGKTTADVNGKVLPGKTYEGQCFPPCSISPPPRPDLYFYFIFAVWRMLPGTVASAPVSSFFGCGGGAGG
ncbi:hypothetical protein LY78DRAFT_295083 [Colletotrichum sublineola]|nr:hypothetical protein LY78DRAFT_295083 [Colletotrichum sublineola]